MTLIKIMAQAVRAILGWLGPAVVADRKGAAPEPVQPQARVHASSPAARRGGRPHKHFLDRPATDAERVAFSRRHRKECFETALETGFETSPHHSLKSQRNKNREPHSMPEDWWRDNDGYQLGTQAFGPDGMDAAITRHRDTWLSRPTRLTDKQWQAKWRAWCRLHVAPPPPLGPQLATRSHKQHGRHDRSPGRQHRPNGHKNAEWANKRKSALKHQGSESSGDSTAADQAAGDRHGPWLITGIAECRVISWTPSLRCSCTFRGRSAGNALMRGTASRAPGPPKARSGNGRHRRRRWQRGASSSMPTVPSPHNRRRSVPRRMLGAAGL